MLFEQQVKQILEQCDILSMDSYRLQGEEFRVFHQQAWVEQVDAIQQFGANIVSNSDSQKQQLQSHLGNSLYGLCYCGIPLDKLREPLPPAQERMQFMQQLSGYNIANSQPDVGWRIYHIDDNGQIFTRKNGRLRPAYPGSYQLMSPAAGIAVNQYVQFPRIKENTRAQEAFYIVYGDTYLDRSMPQIRIYFHIKPDAVPGLLGTLTQALNYYKVPFSFKCINHPASYHRRDSAVLYVEKPDFDFTVRVLQVHVFPELKQGLETDSPLFTQPIVEGISYAEDPGQETSFGSSRSHWLAQALVEAFAGGLSSPQERYQQVTQFFAGKGIDMSRLHLNPHTRSLPELTQVADKENQ